MRKTTIELLLFAMLTGSSTSLAETPRNMVRNVAALAEAAAVLNICFESDAYSGLPTDKALELHDLSVRLEHIVETISEHYNDDALLMFYELRRTEVSEEVEMKNYSRKKYQYCGDDLFQEMRAYVSKSEKLASDE